MEFTPSAVNILGVIPARGGSKGIPRKNLRCLNGTPLIAHTIKAAIQAKLLNKIVVTTDDIEIANISKLFGISVLMRPPSLAMDNIQNNSVVEHVLKSLDEKFTHLVLLQPTSPLRRPKDIDICINYLLNNRVRSVVSVTEVDHHPSKFFVMDDHGMVTSLMDATDLERRRQELKPVYRQNGAIYALGVRDFISSKKFILFPCGGHVMAPEISIDIDKESDLKVAENFIEIKNKGFYG